jgi:hypothetical protein
MAGLAIDGLGQDIESFRHLWILLGLVLAHAARPRDRVNSTRVEIASDQKKRILAAAQ